MPAPGPFSPQILSLLTQKFERNKDRNLQAATAEREFIDRHRNRLLKKMMAEEELGASERNSERAAVSRMTGRSGGGAAAGESSVDRARAALLESQKYALDKKLPFDIESSKALAAQRTGNAEKATAKATEIEKMTDPRVLMAEAKALRERAGLETDAAHKERLLSQARLAEERAVDLRETRPSRIGAKDAQARNLNERSDTEAATREGKVGYLEARKDLASGKLTDMQKTLGRRLKNLEARSNQMNASAGLSKEKRAEIERMSKARMAYLWNQSEAVAQSTLESMARVEDKELRREFEDMKLAWEKIKFDERQVGKVHENLMGLMRIKAKVDPEFGGLVVEENPSLAKDVGDMAQLLIGGILDPSARKAARETWNNERKELVQKGGGTVPKGIDPAKVEQFLNILRAQREGK